MRKGAVKEGFTKRRHAVIGTVVVLIILIGIVLIYFNFFFTPVTCGSYECFRDYMVSCTRAKYVNDEPEASWRYEILGKEDGSCDINVKLLQTKQGELGFEKLQGLEMVCSYPLTQAAYPEKDLNKCHGRLKEELQTIIINKLHAYLIENLGQVDEGLNRAV